MSDQMRVRRAVEVIMGMVVGLTFLFGFGNVVSLGLRLGLRQLTANGAGEAQLSPSGAC